MRSNIIKIMKNNDVFITYAITVCNEIDEIKHLVEVLKPFLDDKSQLVIQSDMNSTTSEVWDYLSDLVTDNPNLNIDWVEYPLDLDFSSYKNNLFNIADGRWIFQLDADEYPMPQLIENLVRLLKENDECDVILVPRINSVNGITEEHIERWGWVRTPLDVSGLDADSIINFPDYQWRLYKNKEDIKWVNKVHERLIGFDVYTALPQDSNWSLVHIKDIDRQEKQNDFYDTIE